MDRSFCDERKSCWLLRICSKNLIPAALTACLVMYPGFNAPILAKHNCLLARNTTEASCQWPILFNTHKRNRKPKTRRRHRQENFLTVCSAVSQDMSVLFCVDLVFMATSSFRNGTRHKTPIFVSHMCDRNVGPSSALAITATTTAIVRSTSTEQLVLGPTPCSMDQDNQSHLK